MGRSSRSQWLEGSYDQWVCEKLWEAEREAQATDKRYTHEEVMAEIEAKLQAWMQENA